MMYVLDGHQPIKVEDPIKFANWLNAPNRLEKSCVGRSWVNGRLVSTVFLGLDYSSVSSKKELFETEVFASDGITPVNKPVRRYATWEDAERGHQEVVSQIKNLSM